jgi:hypothetical protein
MPIRFSLAIVAVASLLLNACANRPVSEWQDEGYTGPIRDVLIIGVSEQQTTRQIFEKTFVSELAKRDVAATASTTLMAADDKISKETVEAAIEGKSIDTVLVTRLLGVEEREAYYEPTTTRHYRNYYTYYSHSWNHAYAGSYRKYDVLQLETNVYDVKTSKLVWSMHSESVDPQSATQTIKDQIKLVIKTLSDRELL